MRIVAITEDPSLTVNLAMLEDVEVVSAADVSEAAEAASVAMLTLIGLGGTERGLAVAGELARLGVRIPSLVVGDVPVASADARVLTRPYTIEDLRRSIDAASAGIGEMPVPVLPVAPSSRPHDVEEPPVEPATAPGQHFEWRTPDPVPPPAIRTEPPTDDLELPMPPAEPWEAAEPEPIEAAVRPLEPLPAAEPERTPPERGQRDKGEGISDVQVADTLALIDLPPPAIRIPFRDRNKDQQPPATDEAPAAAPAVAEPVPPPVEPAVADPPPIEIAEPPPVTARTPALQDDSGVIEANGMKRLVREPASPGPSDVAARMDEAIRSASAIAGLLADFPFLAEPGSMMQHVLRETVQAFEPETAVVYVESADGFRAVAAHGLSAVERAMRVPPDQAIIADVALTLDPVLVDQVDLAQELIDGIAGVCTEALMAAPVVIDGVCEAIVVVGRDALGIPDLERLASLAAEAGIGFRVSASLGALLRRD